MEKVVQNSKFFGHSTEIIQRSKIKGPLIGIDLGSMVKCQGFQTL